MVSVIILSYNTEKLLRECLAAVYTKLRLLPFEVIVLDNASKDGSVAMVKKDFPKAHIIESHENLGFAKGINIAAKKAQGEYLLFLNSDATLLDANLSEMIEILKKKAEVGIIGGNLLNKDNTTSDPYGKFYLIPEVFRFLFFAKKAKEKLTGTINEVDWISGGYMLTRRDLFEQNSGFDEHFFMYIEDMELCYRLKMADKVVYYYELAKARHVGQGSSNRTFAIVNIFRGIKYFYKKHRPSHEYFVVQLLLFMKALGSYTVGLVSGNTYLRLTYSQAIKVLI